MKYVGSFHFPGCLNEGDGQPTFHETAAEAWKDLLEIMGDDRWELDDEDDPDGPQNMTVAALTMERMEAANMIGSVYGNGGIYEVEAVNDYAAEKMKRVAVAWAQDRNRWAMMSHGGKLVE